MTDTVFQEDGADQPVATEESSAFNATEGASQSYLNTLVGEGKKYANEELLAKSRVDADAHISKLEQELAELRENQVQARTREEILEELKALASDKAARDTETRGVASEGTQSPNMATDEVRSLVEQTLSGMEAAKAAEANEKLCSDKLVERYGDTAQKVLEDKASQLGISVNDLRADAQRSPAKLLALFGIEHRGSNQRAVPTNPVETNVNSSTESFETGGAPKHGSRAYFEKMRKENTREYWKPETQAQILKAHRDGLYGI